MCLVNTYYIIKVKITRKAKIRIKTTVQKNNKKILAMNFESPKRVPKSFCIRS